MVPLYPSPSVARTGSTASFPKVKMFQRFRPFRFTMRRCTFPGKDLWRRPSGLSIIPITHSTHISIRRSEDLMQPAYRQISTLPILRHFWWLPDWHRFNVAEHCGAINRRIAKNNWHPVCSATGDENGLHCALGNRFTIFCILALLGTGWRTILPFSSLEGNGFHNLRAYYI